MITMINKNNTIHDGWINHTSKSNEVQFLGPIKLLMKNAKILLTYLTNAIKSCKTQHRIRMWMLRS